MDTRAQVSHPIFGALSFAAYVLMLPLGAYIAFATGDWSVLGMWCGLTAFLLLLNYASRRGEPKDTNDGQQATLTDYGGGE